MSNHQITTTVRAKLDIIFRNGPYGKFPVGTLRSNIGTFACNDKWLETLDAGSYEGQFDIDLIRLRHYRTTRFTPEFRFYLQAVICAYHLDSMSDEVEDSEYEMASDPMLDEMESEAVSEPKAQPVIPTVPVVQESKTQPQPEPESSSDEESSAAMVKFIQEQLRSVGCEINWQRGDALTIPADLERAEQRKMRDYLIGNGYRMTDPIQRLWEVAEVNNA